MDIKEKYVLNSEFDALFDLPGQKQEEVDALVLAAQFLAVVSETLDARKLSRKDFASLLGTSASWLTQLFRGDKLPSLTMLSRMADVLDIQYDIRQWDKPQAVAPGETEQIALIDRVARYEKAKPPFIKLYRPDWGSDLAYANEVPRTKSGSPANIPMIA